MQAPAIDSTDFYRRQARKLRYEHRGDPTRLQRSLQALSQWQNLSSPKQPIVWRRESRTDHVQDLVAAVSQHMEGPLLRYPARLALLKQARRAGLDQFHANLIITAAQHKAGERIPRLPSPKNTWLPKLGIALVLQAWIIAGLWWMLSK